MASGSPSRNGLRTFDGLLLALGAVSLVAAIVAFLGLDVTKWFNDPTIFLVVPSLLLLAVLAWRDWAWVYLATGIAVTLIPLLVFLVFGGAGDLLKPTLGNQFASSLLLLLALLLAVPAGVHAFVSKLRKRPLASARDGWGTPWGAVVVVGFAVFLGLMLAGSLAAKDAASAAGAGGGYDFAPEATAALATENTAFSPDKPSIEHAKITEIAVTNKDTQLHTFTYVSGGKEYSHDLLPGITTRFLVNVPDAGTIPFRCKPHSTSYTDGMIGSLIVT